MNRQYPWHSSTPNGYRRYACSCGLLLLPAIAWNLAFTSTLMPASAMAEFWRDIPAPIAFAENALRAVVFGLPFAMPLHLVKMRERCALAVFVVGTLAYFASWLPLMYWPQSAWSGSLLGSLAPAWTPIVWLAALAVLGRRLFWCSRYRWWMYLLACIGFLAAHVGHAAFVQLRST